VTTKRIVLAAACGVVVFGLLWEGLVRALDVRPFVLLPPSRIVSELAEQPARYAEAGWATGRHALLGLLFALAVALLIGAALAASRFLEQAAQPVLVLILVAPWVAYFSSIVLWLGRGDPPVIFLVAFVTMPVFVFATVSGLRSADPAARELLASVDATRVEVLWRLRLPSALPFLLATSRYVFALALAASYYGEGGNLSNAGLGALGRAAANASNGPVLWATVLATVLLGVIGLAAVTLLERALVPWHASQRTRWVPGR
jgi:NitT/TauT family transport system permease protein